MLNVIATHANGGSTVKQAETQAEAESIAQTLLDHGIQSGEFTFDAVTHVEIEAQQG